MLFLFPVIKVLMFVSVFFVVFFCRSAVRVKMRYEVFFLCLKDSKILGFKLFCVD